jgi:hypothetical protein
MPGLAKKQTARNSAPRKGTRYSPWEHAARIGLQVLRRPLRAAISVWMPDHHTVVVRSGLSHTTEREAVAHAVAHAELGHIEVNSHNEEEADLFALTNLVTPHEFGVVARTTMDRVTISTTLKITPRLLDVYLLK